MRTVPVVFAYGDADLAAYVPEEGRYSGKTAGDDGAAELGGSISVSFGVVSRADYLRP